MALEKDEIEANAVENSADHEQKHAHATDFEAPTQHVQELGEAQHVNLSWRTWVVVFVACVSAPDPLTCFRVPALYTSKARNAFEPLSCRSMC